MASARTDRSGDLLPRGGSAHPLLGADLRTVIALLRRHGVRPGDRLGVIAGALASSAVRAPISLCERAIASRAIARLDPEPPIFILGHWRSGTTHLYNILSRSDDFAFVSPVATGLPWDALLLGRALRPVLERALPRERFIDPLPVNPDSPQEDEAALANMQTVSFYHGLYFPRRLRQEVERGVFFDGLEQRDIRLWEQRFRHFLGKVSLLGPKRRPVIKNPVYTARLGMIQRMFPRAQYIHIHRNPYSVFFSMRRFYTKLLEAYALQPYSLDEIDELVLSVYERMMDRMLEDVRRLPDGALVEISYDELASTPESCLRTIGEQLGMADEIERSMDRFTAYIESVRGYTPASPQRSTADLDLVESRWGRFIDRWGYARPDATQSASEARGARAPERT